jgi:hypothetical protein
MFARPSKQLPGKWELYEYYTEPEGNLIHKEKVQLQEENLQAQIEFLQDGNFLSNSNLPENIFHDEEPFNWSVVKNFVTLIHESDFRNNEEFQFAIEKQTLKLLQKDSFGKIVFFGFFKKVSEAKINHHSG